MSNKTTTFTWSEAIKVALPELAGAPPQAEVATVITYARNFGIGSPITQQKTHYTAEQLDNLRTLLRWWMALLDSCNISTSSKASIRSIVRSLSHSVASSRPLPILAIFCPSYKSGIGQVGFESTIGKHTTEVILQLLGFVQGSESAGLPTQTDVYFSDLLLENYDLLKGTEYGRVLDSNYESFQNVFHEVPVRSVALHRLSSLPELVNRIGEEGSQNINESHDPKLFRHVHLRNRAFYSEQLGWEEGRILRRTRVLYDSYRELGRYFRSQNSFYVIYWTESAYERAPMYSSGLPKSLPFPVIFPKK